MPRIAIIIAASVGLVSHVANAQVRTSPVLVRYYRQTTQPVPPTSEVPGSTLLGLDCRRGVTPRRGGTHCTVVEPAVADHHSGYVQSLTQCYSAPATPIPRPSVTIANTLRTAFETSHSEGDPIVVTLPPGTPPVFVIVHWTNLGLGSHCIRWTRDCQGLDCRMTGTRRWCAASTTVPTQDSSVDWAWISGTTVHLVNQARFYRTEAMVIRFESASLDASDTDVDRATIGTLDASALRALAARTQDPVTRHAAWLDLAVEAWRTGQDGELREAADRVAHTLVDALAVVPAASRSAFSAPAEQLAQRLGWRGSQTLDPCGTPTAPP